MHKQSTHRTILRALCRCLVKRQQLLGVAQSMISNMTFVAIHILSPDHCALNGISEVSSPKEYPTSENTDRWVRSRQGLLGVWGGAQQKWPEESSNPITSYLLFRKATQLTRELGQDDFGKPHVVLAAQTFSFLFNSLLIIGWEFLFTFREEAIPVRCFSEGFPPYVSQAHTTLDATLSLFSLRRLEFAGIGRVFTFLLAS